MSIPSKPDRRNDQVLPARISLPPHRICVVPRKGLFPFLEECLSHRLTLISAPAGYGKTTLVSDWLSTWKTPAVWLSLSKEDNEIPIFQSLFIEAIQQIQPGIARLIGSNPSWKQPHEDWQQLVSIIHEMDQVTPGVIVVLDDYHVIENPKIHEFIQFYLQNYSSWMEERGAREHGFHPVLITRSDPPFPISRWRTNLETIELRANDLKFSREEAAEFLKQRLGEAIPLLCLDRMAATAEGWVTGLQLNVLIARAKRCDPGQDGLVELNGSDPMVVDYMMEQVIRQLPDEIQRFLYQTSILGNISVDLCDCIRGEKGSQRIIEQLIHDNLFLIPMDNQQGWYRYHQLFLDVLIHNQYVLGEDLITESHARAARWLAEKGYFPESLKHWLKTGNIREAARMMEKAGPVLLNTAQFQMLDQLLNSFPAEAFNKFPWLSVYRCWSISECENKLDYWFEKTMRVIHNENYPDVYSTQEIDVMMGNLYTIRALHKAQFGDNAACLENSEKALSLLPANELNVMGLSLLAIAKTHFLDGNLEEAFRLIIQSSTMQKEGGNLSGVIEAELLCGEILLIQGKLKGAYQYLQQAVSYINRQAGREYLVNMVYSRLGQIEMEWNQLDRAVESFRKSESIRNLKGLSEFLISTCGRIRFDLFMADFDHAESVVNEIEPYIVHPFVPEDIKSLLILSLIRYYLALGNTAVAGKIISERNIEGIHLGNSIRWPEQLGLYEYLWKTHKIDQVIQYAERMTPILAQGNRIDTLIHVLVVKSLALMEAGRMDEAESTFLEALHRGTWEGYFNTFVEFGQPLSSLLCHLMEIRSARPSVEIQLDFIQKVNTTILARQSSAGQGGNSYPRVEVRSLAEGEHLTATELVVLRYLARGNGNKTIASELRLSTNTIKTHMANIYSKLGAHNRVDAVNKAKAQNLL